MTLPGRCPIRDCTRGRAGATYMCHYHWMLVPADVRRKAWSVWDDEARRAKAREWCIDHVEQQPETEKDRERQRKKSGVR